MPQRPLNVGLVANDGTGDSPRVAGQKLNADIAELYASKSDAGHKHPSSDISDATAAGRALLTAQDAASQLVALGIGSTGTGGGGGGGTSGQPADPGLTSLAGLAGAGVVVSTATDVFALRPAGTATPDAIPSTGDADARYAPKIHQHSGADITSGLVQPARLGLGAPSSSTVLYGDGWRVPPTPSVSSGGGSTVFRTPSNSGFTVTRDGTGDNTNALNNFFALLATSGDAGYVEAGDYRTTAELLLPREAMYLRGAHRRLTRIRPAAATYHGFRAQSDFDLSYHGRYIGGFSVIGPDGTPARNGKAGFMLDRCPQAIVDGVMVDNYDIGFDSINNSYNAHWRDIFTNRNNSNVNCGMNIREGNSHSGSDWVMQNVHLAGRVTGMCIAGLGGGYRLYGFSIGTIGVGGGLASNYGVITLGWDYASDTELNGIGSMIFSGGHIEGWRNAYAFTAHGEMTYTVQGCGFVPSAFENGQQALGIYSHDNPRGVHGNWLGNDIGGGQFSQGQVCRITGTSTGSFYLNEQGWTSAGQNYVGPNTGGKYQFGNWLRSLLWSSNVPAGERKGFSTWADPDTFQPTIQIGKGWLRPNPGANQFLQSWDDGATWTVV